MINIIVEFVLKAHYTYIAIFSYPYDIVAASQVMFTHDNNLITSKSTNKEK